MGREALNSILTRLEILQAARQKNRKELGGKGLASTPEAKELGGTDEAQERQGDALDVDFAAVQSMSIDQDECACQRAARRRRRPPLPGGVDRACGQQRRLARYY